MSVRYRPASHREKVRAEALGHRPGHAFVDRFKRRKGRGRKPRAKK